MTRLCALFMILSIGLLKELLGKERREREGLVLLAIAFDFLVIVIG